MGHMVLDLYAVSSPGGTWRANQTHLSSTGDAG